MFISKKKLKELEERITKLEREATAITWDHGKVTFPQFVRRIERQLAKRDAASGN